MVIKKDNKFFIMDNVCTPYKLILSRTQNFLLANSLKEAYELSDANVVIVGTCAAFDGLRNEALDLIEQGHKYREAKERQGKEIELVIFGCLLGIEPQTVRKYNADKLIPASHWQQLEGIIKNPSIPLMEVDAANEFRTKKEYRLYDWTKQFVLTQTGCSSNCPFCPHKLGIGELKSIPLDVILKQVKSLTEQGVGTICLTGNDTGSWGTDIGDSYPNMVRNVLEFSNDIHLTQINPDWIDLYQKELFEILMNPKIKELQVCIQSSSDRVLSLMERHPVVKKIEPFLKKVRLARPDLIMRTDLIIGYPGSTEEEDMDSVKYTIGLFDEVAIHGFEKFDRARITKMDINFFSKKEVEGRINKALSLYKQHPEILIHRGGQEISSLEKIEIPKNLMRGNRKQKYDGELILPCD